MTRLHPKLELSTLGHGKKAFSIKILFAFHSRSGARRETTLLQNDENFYSHLRQTFSIFSSEKKLQMRILTMFLLFCQHAAAAQKKSFSKRRNESRTLCDLPN